MFRFKKRFEDYAQNENSNEEIFLSATISVADMKIRDLCPLGYKGSGLTKAGRFSFCGYYNGQKVKVYTCDSTDQVRLRVSIQDYSFSTISFPRILATDGLLVVEEWIVGAPPMPDGFMSSKVCERVDDFFKQLKDDRKLIGLAKGYRKSFCYIDFLLARATRWSYIDEVASLLITTKKLYCKASPLIPVRISHPDVSQNNLIIENRSDNIYIIDNELLGVGLGWVLDRKNSLLEGELEMRSEAQSRSSSQFEKCLWDIRLVCSALEAGDVSTVNNILEEMILL